MKLKFIVPLFSVALTQVSLQAQNGPGYRPNNTPPQNGRGPIIEVEVQRLSPNDEGSFYDNSGRPYVDNVRNPNRVQVQFQDNPPYQRYNNEQNFRQGYYHEQDSRGSYQGNMNTASNRGYNPGGPNIPTNQHDNIKPNETNEPNPNATGGFSPFADPTYNPNAAPRVASRPTANQSQPSHPIGEIQQTISIIKPDAVGTNHIGDVISRFEKSGLRIAAIKMAVLTKDQAGQFYAVHKDKPFYPELVNFMSSGPVVVLVLEGQDAIAKNRQIMGATNPEKAERGTLRADYAESVSRNAVHGSDSPEAAKQEIDFFFKNHDIYKRY